MYDKKAWLKKVDDVIAAGPYADNWESLAKHRTPEWFMDAKFGIFIHWGVYSVPAFGTEWYSRMMYVKDSREYEHHIATYGSQKDFGYKDFIPMFKAEKYEPSQWAQLFKKAGAKYVVPVAEHHDGFQMYKSEASKWNAYDMGPKRDLHGDLVDAVQEAGLVNGASTHRIEHWFFMNPGRHIESDITDDQKEGDFYWPAAEEADFQDIHSKPTPTKEFLDDWMMRTLELVDNYRPKILYFDWWIQHESAKPYLKKIAAYYYNRAIEWGEEVVICYKHDAFMFGTALVDIERGQFDAIQPFYWQTDTAIAKNSWCYTENNDFKKAKNILCDFVDIISKNGNLLLNVGPRADGTITDEDRAVLEEIGEWMEINADAVYGSRVWRMAVEGPTQVAGGQFTDAVDKVFTAEDFRFTTKGEYINVFALAYPECGEITIKALGKQDASHLPKFHGIIEDVTVLGFEEKPVWSRDEEGLHIKTTTVASDKPICFRVKLA